MDTATFFEKFSLFAQAEDAATRFREVVLNLAFSGKLKGTDLSGWETHPIGDFFTEGLKSINAPESPNQTYELWSVPSFETGAPEIVTGAQVGSTKRELRDGTILLGKINPHLNRIWVVNRRTNHPMIASQEWINVTAGDKWDTGYLARLLSSPSFNRSVCATAQGMGSLTRANTKQVAQIVVHCPPLKEQQKLIAKVDELMALCDRLEAQLKERDVKQAAIAKAALAKFTEDPTPENLQLLFHPLFSIPTEDLQGVVRSLAAGGKLVARTSSWNKEKLGDLCIKIGSGSTPTGGKEAYHKSGTPLIRSMNVHFDGIHDEGLAFLNDSQAEKLKNVTVAGGDVLLNITGASIGRVAVAPERIAGARVNQHVCIIRTLTKLTPRFLALVLASPEIQNVINNVQVGATREALNKSMIQDFDIPMPSIEEQNLTSDKASALLEACKLLESQLEASRTTGEKLLEAMAAELTSA
jgi:type I restriction enzyme S subunit